MMNTNFGNIIICASRRLRSHGFPSLEFIALLKLPPSGNRRLRWERLPKSPCSLPWKKRTWTIG